MLTGSGRGVKVGATVGATAASLRLSPGEESRHPAKVRAVARPQARNSATDQRLTGCPRRDIVRAYAYGSGGLLPSNAEDAVWYAPANDPFVITVGCLDDNQTAAPEDDSLCPISSRGVTQDGFAKPDLVAPGRKIESALSSGINGQGSILAGEFPDRITADGEHIRLSGTSMAAPQVTAAIALLLQRHGGLLPNQVRQLLVNTASTYPGQPDQAGVLNIPAALV